MTFLAGGMLDVSPQKSSGGAPPVPLLVPEPLDVELEPVVVLVIELPVVTAVVVDVVAPLA
jgi:hypothetical protein